MDTIITGAPIYALLGVIITVLVNYFIQRKKSNTDIVSKERERLSVDQEQFKSSILKELNDCRHSVEKMHKENEIWQGKLLEANEKKLLLVGEIITLKQRINELESRIQELEKA